MPSGITAKLVADYIIESINAGKIITPHRGSLGTPPPPPPRSAGYGITKGSAIRITTFPIVPDDLH